MKVISRFETNSKVKILEERTIKCHGMLKQVKLQDKKSPPIPRPGMVNFEASNFPNFFNHHF